MKADKKSTADFRITTNGVWYQVEEWTRWGFWILTYEEWRAVRGGDGDGGEGDPLTWPTRTKAQAYIDDRLVDKNTWRVVT